MFEKMSRHVFNIFNENLATDVCMEFRPLANLSQVK